ncbi:tripartite tricarboxylate transporter substrate-binding protein [Variovorax sp. HW608]|uniref:tripartite tricarboxylate transporter substrate-binding protein n=1 Tax=Variovorax sp. HW608 TaxID=1034889 RepID=UPI000B5B0841|nr:tripartite tricarboxylate transporter substrate-binding protein [Variovorax sp. HW608]
MRFREARDNPGHADKAARVQGWPGRHAADVVAQFNAELNKALAHPNVVALFANSGFKSMAGAPEDFRNAAREERARWGRVIKTAGVQLD